MAFLNSSKKTLKVEDQIEGETIETSDYFFCKVGESISLMSDGSNFDANNPPTKPLDISQRLGLIFAAHSSGFCVAKIKDVVVASEEIKNKGSGFSVQELSVADVHIGRVSILALSIDSSFVSVVVGGEIQCFMVDSLLNKDKKPVLCCSVEQNHVKDMLWIKETEPSFIVLTYSGTVHLGTINKTLKLVMDSVDAVGRSEDGNHIAIGRKNNLSIFSSKFEELFQVVLPMDMWTGENNTIKVDSIRWIRSDSIVVGCFQQTEDGKEENYFIQVIMNKDGEIIKDTQKLTSVDFSDLFTGIVDDIVPCGFGPHLFVNYLENGGFAFVSNRKNTDQHIMLFDWSQGNNQVSLVYIDRDTWLPRIELQESGDENLILGLCVDESSVCENVKVKLGLEEERELLPHCLLMCLTLEGKFLMFKVASISGPQRSNQALSTTSFNAQSISVVGPSDIGEANLQLEEERAKQSSYDLGLRESYAKQTSSALSEVSSGDQKKLGEEKYTFGNSHFNQTIREEVISGGNNQKAVADVKNSKPFGRLGQSREGLGFVAGDVGSERRNTEHGVSLTDKFLDKNLTSSGQGVEEKTRSDGLNSTLSTGASSTSLGVCNARSQSSSLVFPKSALSEGPLSSTDRANRSGGFFGNLGSHPSNSFVSGAGKVLNFSHQSIASSGVSGVPCSINSSSKMQLKESSKLQNFTGETTDKMVGNDKKSSPFGQPSSQKNLPKQFSTVQNMANELDKLLESIEEAGGFRDVCTAAHKNSVKELEEGMDSLYERNRVWQNCMEERLEEIQVLLDKTVQVLARKTHMEGIVRQTTDGQYWELWNRQKLNSELDQKQHNVLNQNQDLINRMIELEKHFNTLEMNLYGESSGVHLASRTLNSRSAQSRNNQSLHAIHNATISQLAAAKQLSDSLSKQMDLLSIKSPPTKLATVKRQVFESIGIPYPDDSPCSPNSVKVDSPSNSHQSVSHSGETRTDSKRIHVSGVSSHDLETARRRRDSLDRNWANFEAPKTTVKRIMVQNEPQKFGSLFSSMDKQFESPDKLERPIASYSKVLTAHGRNDSTQKLNSDTLATSKFKWAGGIPELSVTGKDQPPKWQLIQGESFSANQNRSPTSPSSSFLDPNLKKGSTLSVAERPVSQMVNIDRPDRSVTASADTKPSALQFTEKLSTSEKIPPRLFSFPNGGQNIIASSKETELTNHGGGQIISDVSSSKQDVASSPPVFPPVNSSSLPNLCMKPLPITTVEGGSNTSTRMPKDTNKEVLQLSSSAFSVSSSFGASLSSLNSKDSKEVLPFPSAISVSAPQTTTLSSLTSKDSKEVLQFSSAISVSAPQAAPLISQSFKGTEVVDSDSTESFVNPAGEPLKIGPHAAANKENAEKPASSSSVSSNFAHLMPSASSNEVPKAITSSPDLNKSPTDVSSMVSYAPEKQPATVAPSSISSSEPGDTTGGQSNIDATVSQEDEMEEEAPETNQTSQNSLGSFASFGLGSTPLSTAPKSNPFGGPITTTPQIMPNSVSLTVPSGELFRPASLSFQSLQASQPSQSLNVGAPSSAFGFTNSPQISSGSGFGQPSQIGSGQQALGSVLGSFGQSRQLGAGLPGRGFGVAQSPVGGFLNAPTSGFGGGFATAGTGVGGFASAATGAGFAAAASPSGGGFAAAAPGMGGFSAAAAPGMGGFSAAAAPGMGGFSAAAAPSGGGFSAAAASSGGRFAAAAGEGGGFGAYGKPGTTGFAGAVGGRQAPSELFTQMRR